MVTLLPDTKTQIAKTYARKGYPGIHKLRASCYRPMMIRSAAALKCPEPEVRRAWRLLPPRYFWPTVRYWAEKLGVGHVEAFVYLADLDPDPTSPSLHPLIWPR
jgi:hypothetical protein